MTDRQAVFRAPGPLEGYAAAFDDLWSTSAQRGAFRRYLQGLLLPRDRNKTLSGLAGAEPIEEAQHPHVQKLQYFLSESPWESGVLNSRRLEMVCADPAMAPHPAGVLVLDDSGDRKAGTKTAHVTRQCLGSVGKVDNGIVAVTSVWADERLYMLLHVLPYTPAQRLTGGRPDSAFRTKPQLALDVVHAARQAVIPFRAVVADSFYGENFTFTDGLEEAGLPYVLSLRPSRGMWAPAEDAHTAHEAAQDLPWGGPQAPGDWERVVRRFRDGHDETWWAAEMHLAGYGPASRVRLVVATMHPTTLPEGTTWNRAANLPRPGSPPSAASPADLAEVVQLYGLRMWVEQSYTQMKNALGWAVFMVRSDRAIRRHWALILCAFSFCWQEWSHGVGADAGKAFGPLARPARGENQVERHRVLAANIAPGARMADALGHAAPLVVGLVSAAPTRGATGALGLGRRWSPSDPSSPSLTNYR